MGRWIIFFSYLERFNKIIYKTVFSFFLNLFPFYPSFELLKIKQNHPLLMAINVTVFLAMWSMFLKVRRSYNFFFWVLHFLEVQNKSYFMENIFTFSHFNLFPMINLVCFKDFWTTFMIRSNRFGQGLHLFIETVTYANIFQIWKEMRCLKSKSWNRKEGNIFATICD